MRIDQIRIEAFRSLYDVRLAPGPLMALVGINNSGKSNLMEGIDFLGEVYRHGLELAVNRKGGFENIAFRRGKRTTRPVRFTVSATLTLEELRFVHLPQTARRRNPIRRSTNDGREFQVEHRFAIRAAGQRIDADFFVSEETVQMYQVDDSERELIATIERSNDADSNVMIDISLAQTHTEERAIGGVLDPLGADGFKEFLERSLGGTQVAMESLNFNPLLEQFSSAFGKTRLYQLAPLQCRQSGVPTPNAYLSRHGENLPALVDYIQHSNPPAWQKIIRAMRRIVPGLETIERDFTHDRRLTLRFTEEGVRRAWTDQEVSDGTVQSLALFATLFDDRTPLLLIEEPENSVHPWIIRSFLDSCRDAAKRKQIILTTHSPVLVSYLRPEELSLVWKQAGKTAVERLNVVDPSAEEMWESGELSIFEILDSGWIPQAVPTGGIV